MTQYVLTLSIGPVQGFIASARRSRERFLAVVGNGEGCCKEFV